MQREGGVGIIGMQASGSFVLTGLNQGVTTVTMRYRVDGPPGTPSQFSKRTIGVVTG